MPASSIPRPEPSEYVPFHDGYLSAIAGRDIVAVLTDQLETLGSFLLLSEHDLDGRYDTGKWTVREVIGHLIDSERVMAYRLLCIARGETANLPGYDEARYAEFANARARSVRGLVAELRLVRQSTLALVTSLDESILTRTGTANGWRLSVRAMVHIIGGHFEHHVNVLEARYGVAIRSRPEH